MPLLTNLWWITYALDVLIFIAGAILIIVLLKKKDKEPSVEENGCFGVICERGMDSEELELELPKGEKLKKFFSRTIIIYIVVCMISIVTVIISYFGGLNFLPF